MQRGAGGASAAVIEMTGDRNAKARRRAARSAIRLIAGAAEKGRCHAVAPLRLRVQRLTTRRR